MPKSLLPKGMLVPTTTARLPGGWHGPVENASQRGASASFMLLGAKPSGAPPAHATAPPLPQHTQCLQVIPSLVQASRAQEPLDHVGARRAPDGVPASGTFSPRREGTWWLSFQVEEQLWGDRAKSPGQGNSWVLGMQSRGPGSVSPKMAKPVSDSQPAARSSTCQGGREFGEDSWRGARRPVNLRLCSIPPGHPLGPPSGSSIPLGQRRPLP